MTDLLLTNVKVVTHDRDDPVEADIAVSGGRIERVEPGLSGAAEVIDGGGRLAFPGVVDAHQHWGIYNPLPADTESESRASAQGGVTTALTYMRTGQYYLNKGGPYAEFFPEVLAQSAGRAYVDYGFHLAPMSGGHIDELPELVERFGVPSFKIFMFYGGHGLHGRSDDQRAFLMLPEGERYDYAHFEFVMRGIQAVRERMPELAAEISLSLHCETAEIMTAYTKLVEEAGELSGLAAYSASRPPHSEGLAVFVAAYLAHETGLANVNLLHLSSAKAMDAALRMAAAFPHIDFRREVTIGHLLADVGTADGVGAKVNPPIRPREDVEALWRHVLDGTVDWVVSDHACCREELKFGEPRDDVFLAKAGFGGAEYLLPGLITEGRRRGLPYGRIAALTSWRPATRFGLRGKGMIAPGYDADLCLVDPGHAWTVRARDSESAQEYTPFEGFELTAKVTDTFVRGHRVLEAGKITGPPVGRYVRRPGR
ncbi:amidohydrolase family protein [Nonomuraea rosea]|uniref:Amidohydrolase family protein n=1 Tax=Nonomuraea rosea TaxID=638574 RepID=A0ABP6ZIP6_9ACTN